MRGLAVLIPALDRPHRVAPVVESIRSTAPGAEIVFVLDPQDEAEVQACQRAGASWTVHGGGYASKIRAGVLAVSTAELYFFGADDLEFQPGWFEAAWTYILDGAQAVGVNDLLDRPHRPQHATHFLVTRDYALQPCIDGSTGPLCHEYYHNYVDDEFIATATKRGVYAYAAESHVKHLHPIGGSAPMDRTYEIGRESYARDRRIFRGRQHLWI